jgi:hypothetical protein
MDLLNFLIQTLGAVDEEDVLKRKRETNSPTGYGNPNIGYPQNPLTEEEYDPNAPIEVMGSRGRSEPERPVYGDPEERPITRQRYVLNDDRMAPTKEELKEIVPRSQGYFGSKGTLRDILGGLSDAFLVQGGGDFEYKKLRDRERKGDAMFGFTNNPQQAIERLAAGGYTDEAEELQKNFATQEQNKRVLDSQDAGRQSQIKDRDFDNRDKGYNRIARWTAAGVPYPQLVTAAKQYGILEEELNALGISPDMTPEQRKQIGGMDMTVNQQMQIPFTERRVQVAERGAATGEQNAQSNRIRANRPPAGRAPRSQTELEYFQSIDKKPAAQRTQGEKDFYKKYTQGTGRGSRGSERREVKPPGRFQNWSSKPIN